MQQPNRRTVLKAGTAVAASSWLAADARSAEKVLGANDRIRFVLIGCGGMGNADLRFFLGQDKNADCVGLGDVDKTRLDRTAADIETKYLPAAQRKDYAKPAMEQDYRKLYDSVKNIDAAIVATPDHWHALAAIESMQRGAHVYCEKPLSHNIVEGRAMVDAAQAYKRVTQCGTQQRSGEHFKKAVELVQTGHLGKVSVCRTWIYNNDAPGGIGSPPDGEAPANVDYDRWLGPAPKRAFNPNRFHYQFRWFYDYGSGLMCDWGVHLNDIILWGMKATAPKSVCASGGKYVLKDMRDTPDTTEVVYDFGDWVLVFSTRFANQGGDSSRRTHGMSFHGELGNLFIDRGGFEITPETDRSKQPRCKPVKEAGSPQNEPHVREFLANVRAGSGKCIADMETCYRSTVPSHLGNIALKTGRKIFWDAEKEICTDVNGVPDKDANALLGRERRAGYELPAIPKA